MSAKLALRRRDVLHLTASLGGHLDLLIRLRDCYGPYDCVWVTAAGSGADGIRSEGCDVRDLPRFNRGRPHTALLNVVAALRLALRERPRTLVVTGAGSVVAFTVFARLFGARVIFVETTARIGSPSKSGRILSRLARRVFVQWPELTQIYPAAEVCRPLVYEDAATGESTRQGSGTLVAVGSHRHPFDRLLELVDVAVGEGLLPGPVIAQGGSSRYVPAHFRVKRWLELQELESAIGEAEYVVCHAGTGLISAALRAGRKPLVMARRASLHEHVDDHQAEIVAKLAAEDLLVRLEGRLTEVQLAAAREAPTVPALSPEAGPPLREALAACLSELLRDAGNPAADACSRPSSGKEGQAAGPEAPAARTA